MTTQFFLIVAGAAWGGFTWAWKQLGLPLPKAAYWVALAASAAALAGATLIFAASQYQLHFGENEGDAATARIDPVDGILHLRNPHSGDPISVTIRFKANGDTRLENVCSYMRLVSTRIQLSQQWLDNKFRRLVADLDIKSEMETCSALSPSEPHEIDAYAWDFVSDLELEKIKASSGYLYLVGVWRYTLPGSKTVYIQKYCRYTTGSLDGWSGCGASYDDDTVHLVQR